MSLPSSESVSQFRILIYSQALLKRCSHFSTDMSKEEQRFASAGAICDHISEKRANQLDGCIAELQEALDGVADTHRAAVKLGLYEKTVKKAMMEKPLHRFLVRLFSFFSFLY